MHRRSDALTLAFNILRCNSNIHRCNVVTGNTYTFLAPKKKLPHVRTPHHGTEYQVHYKTDTNRSESDLRNPSREIAQPDEEFYVTCIRKPEQGC